MATTKTASSKKPRARRSTKKYIRNLYNSPVSLRVGGKDGRKIELNPRGMRGDLALIKKDELEDEVFLQNAGILYEVLTEAQAKSVLEKQTTNIQQRHPAIAALRNEKGEKMEGVVMEQEFNERGITVARLKDGNVVIDKHIGIERAAPPGSVENPLPDAPQPKSEQAALERSDEIARQAKKRGLEGPAAGLAGFEVAE